MKEAMIKVVEVSKEFGGVLALDNISMEFIEGEITGIIGGNGAGKTTLFNIITGLEKLTKGNILIKNNKKYYNITNQSMERLTKYGMTRTFQHIRLFPEFTVYENILAGSLANKTGRKEVEYCLSFFGIEHLRNQKVEKLPYGTRRVVEMARCLATGSKLIFLDEIGAGMTEEELEEMGQWILALKEKGITFIIIEHHMKFIQNICTKVFAMNEGKLLVEGGAKEVINSPIVKKTILE